MKTKTIALLLAVALVFGGVVGGTIAWLTDKTSTITNTFTSSDVDIELTETTANYKMVPGATISKDPKVTVKAGSEACWLFVKIEESTNLKDYIDYDVADGWTALAGVDGVYYREVAATTADTAFAVLKDNQVTVLSTVTKAMMDALEAEGATQPTLTFTAYAAQLYKTNGTKFTAAEAWDIVKPST